MISLSTNSRTVCRTSFSWSLEERVNLHVIHAVKCKHRAPLGSVSSCAISARRHSSSEREALQRLTLSLSLSCHSDPAVAGEESRSAFSRIAGERIRARFLSRDCGIGMTGLSDRGREPQEKQEARAWLRPRRELERDPGKLSRGRPWFATAHAAGRAASTFVALGKKPFGVLI